MHKIICALILITLLLTSCNSLFELQKGHLAIKRILKEHTRMGFILKREGPISKNI